MRRSYIYTFEKILIYVHKTPRIRSILLFNCKLNVYLSNFLTISLNFF